MKQNTKHFVKSFSFFSKVNLQDYDAQIADSFHSNRLKLGFGKKSIIAFTLKSSLLMSYSGISPKMVLETSLIEIRLRR